MPTLEEIQRNQYIKEWVTQHLNDPAAVAGMAKQYGLTPADLGKATGQTPQDVAAYFSKAGIGPDLNPATSGGQPGGTSRVDGIIRDYITQNLDNPQEIADKARQYGLTPADISRITGQPAKVVADYFKNAGIGPDFKPMVEGKPVEPPKVVDVKPTETFDEYTKRLGFTKLENGTYISPDPDAPRIKPDSPQMENLQKAYDHSALFYGKNGATSDPVIGGQQFRNIGNYANNDPDPAKALQIEIDGLRAHGIMPINHPQFGWIVPDDQAFHEAHPNQEPNGFDKFLGVALPVLMTAGMGAGIGAGISGFMASQGVAAGAVSAAAAQAIGAGVVTGAITGDWKKGLLSAGLVFAGGQLWDAAKGTIASDATVSQAIENGNLDFVTPEMLDQSVANGVLDQQTASYIKDSLNGKTWDFAVAPNGNEFLPRPTNASPYDQSNLTDAQKWAQQNGGLNPDGSIDWSKIDASPLIQGLGSTQGAPVVPGWDQWISQYGSGFNSDPTTQPPPGTEPPPGQGPPPATEPPPGEQPPAPVQEGPTTPGTGPSGSQPPITPPGDLPPGEQPPAPVQEGPTTPGTGPGGSQPPIVPPVAPPTGGGVPTPGNNSLPSWLTDMFPGLTAGTLGTLLSTGLGIYGANQQANAYGNIAGLQAQNYADAQKAYYDAVNRQTGAYNDATNAYNTRNDMTGGAFQEGLNRYDQYQNLSGQAWLAQMNRYDQNVANQQNAFNQQTDQYNNLLGLQQSAYGDQKNAYADQVAAQKGAYDTSLGLFERLNDQQKAAYADQQKAYADRVAGQQGAYDTSLGLYGQQNDQQMAAYNDRKAMYDAEKARLSGLGEPYRGRLEALYNDPNSFLTSNEVQVPVQQATNIMARSLSVGGNPIGSGNALQQLQSYSADQLFGKLGEEKARLGKLGGLEGAAYQSPAAPTGPTPLQSIPQLQDVGALAAPNYSSAFPQLGSFGQLQSPNYSQAFPQWQNPGSTPSIPGQPQMPTLASAGQYPTMPNPPQYPTAQYSGLASQAGADANMYNAIGSGLSNLLNPQTDWNAFFNNMTPAQRTQFTNALRGASTTSTQPTGTQPTGNTGSASVTPQMGNTGSASLATTPNIGGPTGLMTGNTQLSGGMTAYIDPATGQFTDQPPDGQPGLGLQTNDVANYAKQWGLDQSTAQAFMGNAGPNAVNFKPGGPTGLMTKDNQYGSLKPPSNIGGPTGLMTVDNTQLPYRVFNPSTGQFEGSATPAPPPTTDPRVTLGAYYGSGPGYTPDPASWRDPNATTPPRDIFAGGTLENLYQKQLGLGLQTRR